MQKARKDNHTCFICHNLFDDKDLVYYAAPNASVYHYYCIPCYEEKIARLKFNTEISKIFRIISPGPKLFSRARVKASTFLTAHNNKQNQLPAKSHNIP